MKSVLIVDDSKAMRLIVRRSLRQAGYAELQVDEATNGKEGLEMILKAPPYLVLCDWNMPEMTGIELLTELRSQQNGVRFGFVTTEASPEMRERATAQGALFLIAKPFTPEDLSKILDPILG